MSNGDLYYAALSHSTLQVFEFINLSNVSYNCEPPFILSHIGTIGSKSYQHASILKSARTRRYINYF